MNIIKYLRFKSACPYCGSKLHKNMKNEIYCVRCGFMVLDYFPNTNDRIDHALYLGRVQWHSRKKKKNNVKRHKK